jgi:hypothetical protein
MIGYVPEPNYVGQAPLVENYDPSFGFMLKQGAKKMFSDMSILLPASMADVAISEMRGGKITEEEYKDSEFFDPQIKWDDSFTEAKARLLKDRMDAEREYAYYLEQAQDFTDYIAFYGGVIAGAVPDPLNYIPLLGQFDKPRRALQYAGMGARSSRALLGAADAALLTTLASPLLMAERASYQQKYDAQDVLFDIGIATGLGGGFGALFGRVKPEDSYPGRIPTLEEARAYDPDVPSTITDPPGQLQQFIERVPPENRANAVRKALLQQRAGKPIDVSAEMQPVISGDEVKQTRLAELEKRFEEQENLTSEEFSEMQRLAYEVEELTPDYTVAKLEEPEPLVDEVIAAIEKQSDEELDSGIRELETQNLLKEEDARALARDEDLTTEQSNREIEQYNGDLIFCLMRNG